MTARAHVRQDILGRGIEVFLGDEYQDGRGRYLTFHVETASVDEGVEPAPGRGLSLNNDHARALYEALADHFGHAGHDIRALRKDYDAERGRVDRLIAHLTGGAK